MKPFCQRTCKFTNIDHEVFTGVYWLGQGFTAFPWLLQKSSKPATCWVIQLVSEEPEIKSPLLCQVSFKLKCHSPTFTDLDFYGPVNGLFKLNNSPKEDKGVQAWFPPGGSGCASVVHAYAAWCTQYYMQGKPLFSYVKFWSKPGRWFVFRTLRSWVLTRLLAYVVLCALERECKEKDISNIKAGKKILSSSFRHISQPFCKLYYILVYINYYIYTLMILLHPFAYICLKCIHCIC